MHISPQQVLALMGPLNPDRVESRKQGGSSLSYLAAYDVKATLIKVFGFGGFSAEVLDARVLRAEKDVPAYSGSGDSRKRKTDDDGNPAFNWAVTAMCSVRLTLHDPEGKQNAVYTETAVSLQTGPDHGEVTDFAIKTAESDALKRAAIYLGTQFGLSLYKSLPGGRPNTTDVVRTVLAEGQREEDIADTRSALIAARKAAQEAAAATAGQAPPTDDPVAKAAADLARVSAAPRRGRTPTAPAPDGTEPQ